MMGEEKPQTAIQRMMELRKQQKEFTRENVYEMLFGPSIKVSADIGSPKGDVGTVKVLESTANGANDWLQGILYPRSFNFKPVFTPWWEMSDCPNPLKKFPEDGEIHINVKKRNIKFNFNN